MRINLEESLKILCVFFSILFESFRISDTAFFQIPRLNRLNNTRQIRSKESKTEKEDA